MEPMRYNQYDNALRRGNADLDRYEDVGKSPEGEGAGE
jgi:hypothetical protein